MFEGQPVGEDAETKLFRKAVQVVAESQKASTSYLQRQLGVGYNNAARLIERMEKEGFVSAPDHVGRREVLVDGRPAFGLNRGAAPHSCLPSGRTCAKSGRCRSRRRPKRRSAMRRG